MNREEAIKYYCAKIIEMIKEDNILMEEKRRMVNIDSKYWTPAEIEIYYKNYNSKASYNRARIELNKLMLKEYK